MKFSTYSEGMEYVAKREAEMGKMKFRSTEEYRQLFPALTAMYSAEGLQRQRRRRVEISICIHA